MSLLLKDRVWSMEAPTAKRGVYPLHGYKIGLYRLPITLEDPAEIKSIHDGLKKTFEMAQGTGISNRRQFTTFLVKPRV